MRLNLYSDSTAGMAAGILSQKKEQVHQKERCRYMSIEKEVGEKRGVQ